MLGIGDVHIPVKLFPKRSDPEAHGTLHLRDVLHMPGAVCNIIGGPVSGEYSQLATGLKEDGKGAAITAEDGRRLGYFDVRVLMVLRLSVPSIGPVIGPSMLEPGTHYVINAHWPNSERQRWASAQVGHLGLDHSTNREMPDGGKGKAKAEAASSEAPPYTDEEKAWLNRVWGDEFKFLMAYGLKIYKDEDREEDRRIARAMIEVDEDGDTNTM
ncbi:hypothetical protein MMYC01_207281 [Madurella mycetomatis]|uniref:Uncharacterized protein n=1 Tax=Madurella mycetomatis TaxID=100816 RepID=A0A175W0Y5_9PEZI|nr:hypothetical protein MMYC01_207281 [Madurella mycetomatis]